MSPLGSYAPALALAACVLAPAAARAGPARPAPPGPDLNAGEPAAAPAEEPAELKPICVVEITDARGLPSKVLLLAFEDGVYHVRTRDGREIEVPEAEVKSVRFSPLESDGPRRPPAPKRPPGRDRGRRGPSDERPFPRFRELREKRAELKSLHQQGRLDGHIHDLKSLLHRASSPMEAGKLLAELNMAHNVKGEPLTAKELRALVGSVADPKVRARTMGLARRIFKRRGPPDWKRRRPRPRRP